MSKPPRRNTARHSRRRLRKTEEGSPEATWTPTESPPDDSRPDGCANYLAYSCYGLD